MDQKGGEVVPGDVPPSVDVDLMHQGEDACLGHDSSEEVSELLVRQDILLPRVVLKLLTQSL